MARSRLGLTDELSGNAQADKLGPCTKRLYKKNKSISTPKKKKEKQNKTNS